MGHPTVPLLVWLVLTIVGGVAGVAAVARRAITGLGRSDGSAGEDVDQPASDGRDRSESVRDTGER